MNKVTQLISQIEASVEQKNETKYELLKATNSIHTYSDNRQYGQSNSWYTGLPKVGRN